MKLFKRNNKEHFFIELSKITDIVSALEFNIQDLILKSIELIESITDLSADYHELNYSMRNYKTLKGLKSGFKKYHEIVYSFTGFDCDETNVYFTVKNPLLNYLKNAKKPKNSSIEIEFQINSEYCSIDKILFLTEELIKTLEFEYGVIHKYPTRKYEGEKRVKRGLFSSSISVNKIDHIWVNHQIGILHGYIKKLYSINYLNNSQSTNPIIAEQIRIKGESSVVNSNMIRWTLNEKDYSDLIKSNKLKDVSIVTKDLSFLENSISTKFIKRMSAEQ